MFLHTCPNPLAPVLASSQVSFPSTVSRYISPFHFIAPNPSIPSGCLAAYVTAMAQSDPLSFVNNLFRSSYTPVATDTDGTLAKPKMGDILRSKRVRIVAGLTVVIFFIAFLFYGPRKSLIDLEHFRSGAGGAAAPASCPPQTPANSNVDWSRYAYVQYVTNTAYLCNSVMLFEILHRLGTKADKLMMYPASMHPDASSDSVESKLLLKAQNEYGVKLMPIQVQHRNGGDRKSPSLVISFLWVFVDRD
jgi:hypothetical protein